MFKVNFCGDIIPQDIIFEVEHYECKSRMMHTNEGLHVDVCDKTSNFFHIYFFLGGGAKGV